MDWMDPLGERWWPFFGAAHCIVAVKRVRGAKLVGATWKRRVTIPAQPVPLARRHTGIHTSQDTL